MCTLNILYLVTDHYGISQINVVFTLGLNDQSRLGFAAGTHGIRHMGAEKNIRYFPTVQFNLVLHHAVNVFKFLAGN